MMKELTDIKAFQNGRFKKKEINLKFILANQEGSY